MLTRIFSLLVLLCAISCCTQPEPSYPPWPLIWPVKNDHAYWTLELTRARERILDIERLRTSDIKLEEWNALMWVAQHDEVFCQVKLKELD